MFLTDSRCRCSYISLHNGTGASLHVQVILCPPPVPTSSSLDLLRCRGLPISRLSPCRRSDDAIPSPESMQHRPTLLLYLGIAEGPGIVPYPPPSRTRHLTQLNARIRRQAITVDKTDLAIRMPSDKLPHHRVVRFRSLISA